jgi:hypothetical protein
MGLSVLDVAERHARIQCGSDECVPQRVRPDRLADGGAAGDPADDRAQVSG